MVASLKPVPRGGAKLRQRARSVPPILMASTTETLHIYERDIEADIRTSLSVLCSFIPPGSRVLDLGCGNGAVGRYLNKRDHGETIVDGLTISREEAEVARQHYGLVHVADLDSCVLTDLFQASAYDIVVCADVLEHIRHGAEVLRQCKRLLTSEGSALLSIPNVAYSGLLAELMEGEFRYRAEGLLDSTHLRFYTRRTLLRFLKQEGWQIGALETIERDLPASEFRVAFDALPPAVARHLLALPDALTYQFVVAARPSDAPTRLESADLTNTDAMVPAQALFTAQLFMATGGQYREADKLIATGTIGQSHQTLRFDLPVGRSFSALRFDPADRPGFMHLHRIRLLDSKEAPLWEWSPEQPDVLAKFTHENLVIRPRWALSSGALLLLTGDDPWMELPVPEDVMEQAVGGALEVSAGWPMSADYLALADAVQTVRDEAVDTQHTLWKRIEDLEQRLTSTEGMLGDARGEQVREREAHAYDAEKLGLQANRIQELITRSHGLAAQRDDAIEFARSLQESTVFRASRPIVHAKMWLDRQLGRGSAQPSQRPDVALTPNELPVDIIVPVYRGIEDTKRCVLSVLRSACRTPWRLLIINDASPEPEVTQWLREIALRDARIELLENESNLGFVGTVNRGMALTTDRDVLLLNSDAEVANDWLDRIRSAAYRDQRVASVTPFSNNATICSYPNFCQDNELPSAWSLADIDVLCAQTLAGRVVDVPTGVGFCMYIRRDALSAVGLFDEQNFGKGYGEENDFCQRASSKGWRNLHALDTFVFHAGGVSFGSSKSPRERAAMETMRRLHPRYEADVIDFVRQDPAAPARALLDYARITSRSLPTILAVLHDREGGTLRHVRELAHSLADKASFLILQPRVAGGVALRLPDAAAGQSELRFSLPDQFDQLLEVLRALGVRHIHYQHTLGHSDLVTQLLPERLGVTWDVTVHDFYAACPQISMIWTDGAYCGEEGPAQCRECLRKNPAPEAVDIVTWRERHASLYLGARHVLAPSRDAAQRMAHYVPQANYRLVPHPESTANAGDHDLQPPPTPRRVQPDSPLRIAVLGALSAIKGADILDDVAKQARKIGAPLEFHLVGFAYRSMATLPKANLTVHGRYDDADLPELLEMLQPHLVWFPAQVPETFSYTLSASLASGLPVVGPNLGAFPERLRGRAWSWIRPWDASAADWIDFFLQTRAQNFVSLTAPEGTTSLPAQNPGPPNFLEPNAPIAWYRNKYLGGIPAPEQQRLQESLLLRHLARHDNPPLGHLARHRALRALARLRAMPVMAPVARAVPPRWQARIKNWLSH